jgi:glutathione-regulated potassium-efflux system ancillary protein KefF
MILVLHAHPYPHASRAGSALVGAVRGIPELEVRSLYDLYPDFDIDAQSEQAALAKAQLVVWTHPIYWYTVPGLLKHWFDVVLAKGWAYGEGGTARHGTQCLWAPTAGGDEQDYSVEGSHGHKFEAFAPVVEQTARFCGMHWLPPLVVRGAHALPEQQLVSHGAALRERLEHWRAKRGTHA